MCYERKLLLQLIIQEQLNYNVKHSKATCLEIKLHCKNKMANTSIRENGVGFDITKQPTGIGLTNIRSRIMHLSSQVNLKRSPGKGCALNISLSLL